MLRKTVCAFTATPEKFTILGTTHQPPKRTGFGRNNKMRSKPSDNTAWYDKGRVEWLPRPVRVTYEQLDLLRDWMMRATLDHNVNEFNEIRELHRDWSQHPLMPVLGDVEPKFPLNLYKQNHKAKSRFIYRWHKANHPLNWMWLPRGSQVNTPLHRSSPAEFPENWRHLVWAHGKGGSAVTGSSSINITTTTTNINNTNNSVVGKTPQATLPENK